MQSIDVAVSNEIFLRCLDAVYRRDIALSPLDDSVSQSAIGGLGRAACVSRRWSQLVTELCQAPDWRSVLVKLDNTSLPSVLRAEAAPDLYLKSRPQLALVFASSTVKTERIQLLQSVREGLAPVLAPETPIVCVSSPSGVLGPQSSAAAHNAAQRQLVEVSTPALVATTLRLPQTMVTPFTIDKGDLADVSTYPTNVFGPGFNWGTFILFLAASNPEADQLIAHIYALYPEACVIGGVTTWAWLDLLNSSVMPESGLVGIAISNSIGTDCICSRGCEPVSQAYRVVDCTNGSLRTVVDYRGAERPFLKLLYQNYSDHVLIGAAEKEDPDEGYTLMQVGMCGTGTAVTISSRVVPGHYVQLCQMTPRACKEDVTGRLQALGHSKAATGNPGLGGLLFSCTGRGDEFDEYKNLDTAAFSAGFPGVPLAGFFTPRELGPEARVLMQPSFVTDKGAPSELQRFTSVFGLFSAGPAWDGPAVVDHALGAEMAKMMGRRVIRLSKGQRVVVDGLKAAPQHNGKAGVVRKWLPTKERYQVKTDDGSILALKPTNIKTISEK